jgi:hypothetical protein
MEEDLDLDLDLDGNEVLEAAFLDCGSEEDEEDEEDEDDEEEKSF